MPEARLATEKQFAGPVPLLLCMYLTYALVLSGERAMSGKGPPV